MRLTATCLLASAALQLPSSLRRAPFATLCEPEVDDSCDAETQYCTTSDGFKYIDTRIGTGDEVTAAEGSVVRVSYVASLLSNSQQIGKTNDGVPLKFELGANKVVFWEDAVEGMRIGGERRVLVPPSAKLRLKDASQRELVSEDDTVRFDIVCLGLETGFSEWQIRNGISGAAGDGGRKIRFAVLGLSLLPYLLPDSQRPEFWRSGSTSQLLEDTGVLPEPKNDPDAPPTIVEQRRRLRDERQEVANDFGGAEEERELERELYGRKR